MRKCAFAALFAAGVFAAAAAGQGPVTIKLRKDEVGDRTKQTVTEDTVTVMTADVGGQKQNKTEKKRASYTYVEDVLAKPLGAKKPTKLSRTYELAETETDGVKKTLSYQGKTVLIEKKDAKWEFTANGVPLPEDDAKVLGSEFSKGDGPEDEDLLPNKPVAAGESWAPNLEKLLPLMSKELPFDLAKTGNAASGKLFKSYPKDGMTYGDFELTFSLKPTSVKTDENTINLKPGCTLSIAMKLDGCIDGRANAGTMTTTMAANLDCDLPGAQLKLVIDGKKIHTMTPVK